MLETQKLKFASLLYKYCFPVYRGIYFVYKNRKDKAALQLIRRLLKPGTIVLDIGANIGFYTKALAGITGPRGQVYSFEPDRINFRHLENEMKNFPNVTLIPKAVASNSGSLMLYTSPLLNVDHRTYELENHKGGYAVEKISVDEFISGKFKVDFIKMDIQGSEMEALKGMTATLTNNKDIVLLMELWPYGLSKAGSSAAELFDYISALGFRMYDTGSGKPVPMTRKNVEEMRLTYFTDTNVLVSKADIFLHW